MLHTAPRLVTADSLWAKPSHPGILQARASGGQLRFLLQPRQRQCLHELFDAR